MLQVTKDTLVRAERDLILEYKRKALLTDRIKKVDYSRISQEVEQLLEKKPFHRGV
jgi:dihydroneopterin aldolase